GASFPEPKDHSVTTAKAKAAPAAEKPAGGAHPSLRAFERPTNLTGTNAPGFGSDVVADTLRALEIPYIALNPGASYRGLHDSIDTARDQVAIVRNYTKWDDQPASPAAAREALIRATWIANTAPMGPVYINLDAEMQEAKLAEPLPPIDAARFMPPANPAASA